MEQLTLLLLSRLGHLLFVEFKMENGSHQDVKSGLTTKAIQGFVRTGSSRKAVKKVFTEFHEAVLFP